MNNTETYIKHYTYGQARSVRVLIKILVRLRVNRDIENLRINKIEGGSPGYPDVYKVFFLKKTHG